MKSKRLLKCLLFLSIFYILQFVIGRVIRGDSNIYSRITLHELYTEPRIDTVFLGASHVYRAIDTQLMDSLLNKSTFVCATASQDYDTTYLLLQEVYDKHPEVSDVYVDLDYFLTEHPEIKDRSSFEGIYLVTDYLKNRKAKIKYLLKATTPDFYMNSFLEISRGKVTFNLGKIKNTAKDYLSGKYWKYEYPVQEDGKYAGKGYCQTEKISVEGLTRSKFQTSFNQEQIPSHWIENIQKIMDFCKERNLNLVFYSIPSNSGKIYSIGNYDDYITFVDNFVGLQGYKYYDFNLCKEEYLSLKEEDFYDDNHLNMYGAQKFDKVFVKVMTSNNLEIKNSYFYKTEKEKEENLNETIFYYVIQEDESKRFYNIYPITNKKEGSVITFNEYLIDKNGDRILVEQNISDTKIVYPIHEYGKIETECYLNGNFVSKVSKDFDTRWFK